MDEYVSLLIVTVLAFITPLLFSKSRLSRGLGTADDPDVAE